MIPPASGYSNTNSSKTLGKKLPRAVPYARKAPMTAIPMKVLTNPYSMAVAPDS